MILFISLTATSLVAWLAVLLLPSRAWSVREQLEPRRDDNDVVLASALDRICVLIPARNEATAIAGTLSALAAQGTGLSVIVIDDQSEDETAARVRAAADQFGSTLDVQLIDSQALPEGWGGKLWALEQGLAFADRDYCLLLDAEIRLAPGMLAALLHKAESEQRAMVSIMAKLRCEGFWEKLLVPPFIFFFKLLYPFASVNRESRRAAAAAGGCILVRSDALRAVGGFESIRDALIDDCTLAARVKRSGRSIWLGLSESVVSARSYTSLSDFRRMVTRTAFTQLFYSSLLLMLVVVLMLTMFVVPWLALMLPSQPAVFLTGLVAIVVMTTVYWPTVRYYRLPVIWTFTLTLAGLLFLVMTVESALNYWRGTRAEWKGRRYAAR